MLMLWLTIQVAAAPAASVPVSPSCKVVDMQPADAPIGGAGMLEAACGKKAALLGPATRFSVVPNAVLGTVLVVRVRDRRSEVLLISPAAGKAGVAIDDITRELTRLTGRSADLGLGSVAADASRFAIDGSIGVVANGSTRWLDLKPYAVRAAQVVAAAASPVAASGTGN